MKHMDANEMKINAGDEALRGAFDEGVRAHYQRETEDRAADEDVRCDDRDEQGETREAPPFDDYEEHRYDEEFEEERPKRKKKRSGPDLRPFSAPELLAKNFPEPKFIVPGYVGEGLTILAGRPKIGKSWLALNIAVAVATGGLALGSVIGRGGRRSVYGARRHDTPPSDEVEAGVGSRRGAGFPSFRHRMSQN